MKPGTYILINLLVVGGGIFLYHTIAGSESEPYQPYSVGGATTEVATDDQGRPVVLGGEELLAKRNKARLDDLDGIIAALRDRATASTGGGADGTAARATGEGNVPVDLDPVDLDDPVFDEKTLDTLTAYFQEIRRREQERQQRERLERSLDGLELSINEAQRSAVIDKTLAFQKKFWGVMRQGWPRTDEGRQKRRETMGELREEWKTSVSSLVPTADAEKITNSRLGRAFGLGGRDMGGMMRRGGGDRGNRRGGNRGGG